MSSASFAPGTIVTPEAVVLEFSVGGLATRLFAKLIDLGYVEHDPKLGYRIIKGSMANCPHLREIMQAQIALVGEEVRVDSRGRARR